MTDRHPGPTPGGEHAEASSTSAPELRRRPEIAAREYQEQKQAEKDKQRNGDLETGPSAINDPPNQDHKEPDAGTQRAPDSDLLSPGDNDPRELPDTHVAACSLVCALATALALVLTVLLGAPAGKTYTVIALLVYPLFHALMFLEARAEPPPGPPRAYRQIGLAFVIVGLAAWMAGAMYRLDPGAGPPAVLAAAPPILAAALLFRAAVDGVALGRIAHRRGTGWWGALRHMRAEAM